MVKVNVISRSELAWTQDRSGEVARANRNYAPTENPLHRQVEYTRALRAAKLDRMFAKPFVAGLGGHTDTVQCIALDPINLTSVASGGADGEVLHWNTATKSFKRFAPHRHAIDGMVFSPDGVTLLTASRDRTVKLWDVDFGEETPVPLAEFLGQSPFSSIDHHRHETQFVTAGHICELWDVNRTRPIREFTWGDDIIRAVRFNQIESHLVACTMQDRGVCVFDTRTSSGHTKYIMEMNCNNIAWNQMNPNCFVTGSDDWNCYMFDLRVNGRPKSVFQGHVAPVNSVDFCPTGKRFVSGSADNTIRLYNVDQLNNSESVEMYHTKRMAKVFCVRWSLDSRYLYSGSEDAIVRIWKADASQMIRKPRGPEESKVEYNQSLKERYGQFPEVRRVLTQRNTPKAIARRRKLAKRLQKKEKVKEMMRTKSVKIKPLAKRKTVQSLK